MYLKNNGNKPVTLGKQTIMPDQTIEFPTTIGKNSVVTLLLRRGDLVSVVDGETKTDKSAEKKAGTKSKSKSGTKSDKKEIDKEDSKNEEESSGEQAEQEEHDSSDRQIPGL